VIFLGEFGVRISSCLELDFAVKVKKEFDYLMSLIVSSLEIFRQIGRIDVYREYNMIVFLKTRNSDV